MGGLPECKDWAFICEMQAFFAGGFLPGFWVLSDLSADLFNSLIIHLIKYYGNKFKREKEKTLAVGIAFTGVWSAAGFLCH
jgi:hypothetical protein